MNILFLTSRIPYPPNRGDKVRTFFLLKEFSKHHRVFLFSFIETNLEEKYYNSLKIYCSKIFFARQSKLQSLFKLSFAPFNNLPFQITYYNSMKYKSIIKEIALENRIDCVYTHLIRMAPFAKELDCYKILDYTDAISKEYSMSIPFRKNIISKMFFRVEAKRTEKYERDIINYFDEGWFISKEDIKTLNFSKESKVKLIANPVRLDYEKKDYNKRNVITFVGNLSVPHNITAVEYIHRQIMPELAKINKNVQFYVVGANSVGLARKMDNKNNTKVLGFVENLYDSLINSDLFIAPMFFCAGVQNKVLEAMSVGLPVITTQYISDSLHTKPGKEIIIANNKNEFVNSILTLLDDVELRKWIGKNGRKFVEDNFNREKISHEIEKDLNMIEKAQTEL